MGVVVRQTAKNNLISYLAIALGAINVIQVYPLDLELYGRIQGITGWAVLIGSFLVMGFPGLIIRLLPYTTRDRLEANGSLLTWSTLVVVATTGLLLLLNWAFGDAFVNYLLANGYQINLLVEYRLPIIAVSGALALTNVFVTSARNAQRIALPVLFESLLPKIGIPLLVLAAVYKYVDRVDEFGFWMSAIYVVAALAAGGYAIHLTGYHWRPVRLKLKGIGRREIWAIVGFGILGTLSNQVASTIDRVMVSNYQGDYDLGLYGFGIFVATVITVPAKAINQIVSPIVAEAWKEGDMPKLGQLYRESAEALFAIGGYIYTGVVVCLPYFFLFSEKTAKYADSYTLSLILGGAQLFELVTSINNNLINYTSYFRWNLAFTVLLAAMNIYTNYLFISVLGYGNEGAAIATGISILIYNVVKYGFLKWKMRISPFTVRQLLTALVLLAIGLLAYVLPLPGGAVVNVLLRGGIITVGYLCYLRFTRGVPVLHRLLTGGGKLF